MNALPHWGSLAASLGRGRDTMVAHITPQEAALLKALGGSGTTNPHTGLPEFDDGGGGSNTYQPASNTSASWDYTPTSTYAAGDIPVATYAQPGTVSPYQMEQSGAGAMVAGSPGWYQDQTSGLFYGPQGQVGTEVGGNEDTTWYAPNQAALQSSYPTVTNLDPNAVPLSPAAQAQQNQTILSEAGSDHYLYAVPGTNTSNVAEEIQAAFPQSFVATSSNPNFTIDPTTGQANYSTAGTQALDTEVQTKAQQDQAYWEETQRGSFLDFLPFLPFALAATVATGGSDLLGLGSALPATGIGTADAALAATDVTADAALLGSPATSWLGAAAAADPTVAGDLGTALASAAPAVTDAGTLGLTGDQTGSLFLGATQAAPAAADDVPFDVSGAGAANAASNVTAGDVLGDSGVVLPQGNALAQGVMDSGSFDVGTGSSGGFFQNLIPGSVGNALQTGANWVGDTADSVFGNITGGDILKAGVSGIGTLLSALKGNSLSAPTNAINSLGQNLAQQGQQLAAATEAGNLPAATQTLQNESQGILNNTVPALQNQAQSLYNQANQLFSQVQSGNLPQVGAAQLLSQANSAATQAAMLQSYLTTGTLPAGMQTGIDQAANAAKAAIRSAYASRGMSGSSAEAQDVANVDANKATQGAQLAMQLYSQGVSQGQIADNVYQALVNASTQTMSLGTTEQGLAESATGQALQAQSLGVQAQESVNSTSTALMDLALNTTGLGSQLATQMLQLEMQQDQQLGQSIASFASALAGQPSTKLSLPAGTTISTA